MPHVGLSVGDGGGYMGTNGPSPAYPRLHGVVGHIIDHGGFIRIVGHDLQKQELIYDR